MSANDGCFCKGDSLMSVTVGAVSFGFLSMFGVLVPAGILTIGAFGLPPSSALGVVLTAMFIACVAYVVAGITAILDLRFIALNNSRNFIITTVGYVAALFFLVTGGMTLFSNISTFIVFSASSAQISGLAYAIQSIQFVSCVTMMGCYATYLILQPYIEERQKTNASSGHNNGHEMHTRY